MDGSDLPSRCEGELREAVAYYETERAGLGEEFSALVQAAVKRISEQPDILCVLFNHVRRVNLPRFEYAIIYQHRPDADIVRIIAIMHGKRRPMYWRSRV